MIRKYTRLDVKPTTVRKVFRDVGRWAEWMPTMQSVKVLESSPVRSLIEARQHLMGRTMTQRLEIRFDDQGYTETQVSGRLRRWRTVWRFVEPPAGEGTVVSAVLDVDLGLLGFFVPKRVLQRTIDRVFEQIVSRAEARARRREAMRMPTVWGVLPGQKLSIRVYEAPTELELWIGERRFVVPALD